MGPENSTSIPIWITAATIAFGAVGFAILLQWRKNRLKRASGIPVGPGVLSLTCGSCQHELVIATQQMSDLSPAEVALVVRSRPHVAKRRLAEYDCPHCGSSHVFAVDVKPPQYVGADLYTPRSGGSRCMECGKALLRPGFAKGEYDNKIPEAPIGMDHGLTCQFCKSTFCLECSESVSRKQRKTRDDVTLYCPRCFRKPVVNIFHF